MFQYLTSLSMVEETRLPGLLFLQLLRKDENGWDFVIGSDLVYNQIGVELLPWVMRAHMGPGSVGYYAHTRGRFEHFDIDFMENLKRVGLVVKEVWEPGSPEPPPSPPLFADLFPEMRVAIYELRLASAGCEFIQSAG
mmetsp:Transcript_10668/g.20180  ORF Transcript_10668/g.20180 Transcript_10668/m.20180 type:complete len:138 (-) Transcript_10668:252-665(-)